MLTAEARKFEAATKASSPTARHPGALPPGVPAPPEPAGRLQQTIHTDIQETEMTTMTTDTGRRTHYTGTQRFSHGIDELPDTEDELPQPQDKSGNCSTPRRKR